MTVLILALIIVIGFAGYSIHAANRRDIERTELGFEVKQLTRMCSADSPREFVEFVTAEFTRHLEASRLASYEKEILLARWESSLGPANRGSDACHPSEVVVGGRWNSGQS